jgi:hypothetical protein
MASRSYPRLSVEKFGEVLLSSGDLDPIYIALRNAHGFTPAQRKRFLVAYWLFYHAGFACWASDRIGEAFWEALLDAAENDTEAPVGGRWPRGSERRHFRGEKAVKAVLELARQFPTPERLVSQLLFVPDGQTLPFSSVLKRAKALPQFGPWIAFKVGDMAERVLDVPVDFAENEVFMFDDPRKAALMVWREKLGLAPTAKPKNEREAIRHVVAHLKEAFRFFDAPGGLQRPVGLQEVETILCKYKSHLSGHYPINNDIYEIRSGLGPWAERSVGAHNFLSAMPAPAAFYRAA